MPFGPEGPQIVCHQLTYLKSQGHVQKMKAFREWLFDELNQSMANLG
jgi:hypothetical protein